MTALISYGYIVSAILFVFGLKKLSSPATAIKGNRLSAMGMLLAVCVTLLNQEILSFQWILIGCIIGGLIGVLFARMVAMTAMPEMVALLNGFGGISSLLLGAGAVLLDPFQSAFGYSTVGFSVIVGGITFTGSLIAWGKLSESISGKAIRLPFSIGINSLLLATILLLGVAFSMTGSIGLLWVLVGLSFTLGILSVISIGGGDMPVVISLLNSYSGIAACAAGFAIQNLLLIVAGSLVGASGIILTNIMCKSMNRKLTNVLFSGFGSDPSGELEGATGEVQPISADDAYLVLESARSILFIPGYGMAVAQAQHAVNELSELLQRHGCEVKFAIHPVAGRMPGHMNVLLAEANVPYDQLVDMDDVNPLMDSVDVCVIIGANDVVNPDALDNDRSPIYGMPIIEAHRAKTVFVLKRSMNPGFAGIQNPLFFKTNTRMLFGDAKSSVQNLVTEFKD